MGTHSTPSPSNQFLLEVGTEELPADFLKHLPRQLTEGVIQLLQESQLMPGDLPEAEVAAWVAVWVTPRRVALVLKNLPDEQPSSTVTVKGPPTKIALDATGNPTPAGQGFAKKQGVAVSDLTVATLDGEEYLVCEKHTEGRPTPEILSEMLPKLILGVQGPRFMRWGDQDVHFSRPIRWVVSLWNDTHVPLAIGPCQAAPQSRGHRVLGPGPWEISSVSAYADILKTQGYVTVDPHVRRTRIQEQLCQAAQSVGAVADIDDDLLETVTMLVEHPSVIVGTFQERFLEIPAPVIKTVMASHQKYFPVVQKETGTLRPYFLAVSNGAESAAETIVKGNERVLTARLEDAQFFFQEDRKHPLTHYGQALSGITFQKGLGTLADKTHRLNVLAQNIAQALDLDDATQAHVNQASQLAKADLVTAMVRELTELQGVVGQHYAQLDGEPEPVSTAIYEHYLPRFLGDDLATSPVGIAVSLADKLDTLVAVFSQEKARFPSGSKDPLGLRRLANGFILTVMENQLTLDTEDLIAQSYELLGDLAAVDLTTTQDRVVQFMTQRFRGILLDRPFRYDMIDSVFYNNHPHSPLKDLYGNVIQMGRVLELTQNPSVFVPLYEAANRMERILGETAHQAGTMSAIQTSRFQNEAEHALFGELGQMLKQEEASGLSPEEILQALTRLSARVTEFFEAVLVNDPDPEIKANRVALLSAVYAQYRRVTWFPKLVVDAAESREVILQSQEASPKGATPG